jgi:hypothetical protein
VPPADDVVVVDTIPHPRGWIIVRFTLPLVGRLPWNLDLMLNTGRPQSALSRTTYRTLDILGLVEPLSGPGTTIRNARMGGVAMPDIPMRISAGPAWLGLEGMLGLDYLSQFAEMRLNFETPRLTLVRSQSGTA